MRLLGIFEQVNANIISITHVRTKKINSRVLIEIVFSIQNKNALIKLGTLLKQENGWRVISLEKTYQLKTITFGLVGHIMHTKSMEKLINSVNSFGANVSRFSMNIPPGKKVENSALISFEVGKDDILFKSMAKIERICAQNNLLLIKVIE